MAEVGEPAITVRAATPADRTAVRSFISAETPRGRTSLVLLRAGQGLLWVAVEGAAAGGQNLVGLLLATIQIDAMGVEREEPVGYIHELLVHPAYRRLGVANHLLDAAERYFLDEQGLPGVELVTSFDNEAALHLYRSRGYAVSQVRLSKRRHAEDNGNE
jgi:ribosomal protein S18 acetylase RimI-like enzyme